MKRDIIAVGLDLAMRVFRVHASGCDGALLIQRNLLRAGVVGIFGDHPRCLAGMEPYEPAQHWARELITLSHEVRLMPRQSVRR